jgi:hypothetical protein
VPVPVEGRSHHDVRDADPHTAPPR